MLGITQPLALFHMKARGWTCRENFPARAHLYGTANNESLYTQGTTIQDYKCDASFNVFYLLLVPSSSV